MMDYKESHEEIGYHIHWGMCKYIDIPKSQKVYKHRVEPITEAEEATNFGKLAIQNDRKIKINKTEISDRGLLKKHISLIHVGANK